MKATPTRVLHGLKGSCIGRVDPETGRLFTMAGNPSVPGGANHARRLEAAERMGIQRSVRQSAIEAQAIGARRFWGTLIHNLGLTRGPRR